MRSPLRAVWRNTEIGPERVVIGKTSVYGPIFTTVIFTWLDSVAGSGSQRSSGDVKGIYPRCDERTQKARNLILLLHLVQTKVDESRSGEANIKVTLPPCP